MKAAIENARTLARSWFARRMEAAVAAQVKRVLRECEISVTVVIRPIKVVEGKVTC